MAKERRQYNNDYPSVTTVLGVLRKPALEYWFRVNTAEFCDRESRKGKEIGTQIHAVIQQYIETGKATIDTEYQEEVINALKSFMQFTTDNPTIKFKRSEIPLVSEEYGFNGTIDCVALDGEKLIIGDWKTGKKGDKEKPPVYDEYLAQVSAYVYLFNENNPEVHIEDAIIVPVAKDAVSYNVHKMDKVQIEGYFKEIFLPALKILNFQNEMKRKAKEGIFYVKSA